MEREDLSRVARFEGVDEEPEEPRLPDFRFWLPARRRDEVGSEAGDSPLAAVGAPASRRFSSIGGVSLCSVVSVLCVCVFNCVLCVDFRSVKKAHLFCACVLFRKDLRGCLIKC